MVKEIINLTEVRSWYHVNTKGNIADVETTGCSMKQLERNLEAFEEPSDSKIENIRYEEKFDKDGEEITVKTHKNLVREKSKEYSNKENGLENIFDVQRYSTSRRMTKVTVLVCQFIDKYRRYKKDLNHMRATRYADKSKKIFADKVNTG